MSKNPKITSLSKALAYKLGDPVTKGEEDSQGGRFSAEHRILYLNRAYLRLRRNLKKIMPDEIQSIFPSYYGTLEDIDVVKTAPEISLKTNNIFEVYNLYLKETDAENPGVGTESGTADLYEARYIKPDNYFIVNNGGMEEFYAPNETEKQFYFTILAGKIKILPKILKKDYKADILVKGELVTFQYDSGADIFIPPEYEDMLLVLAAREAAIDDGSQVALSKAQAYMGDYDRELQILIRKAELDRIEEDRSTTS